LPNSNEGWFKRKETIVKTNLIFLVSALAGLSPILVAENWAPISPADLASKQAEVEPGADAEAIFWEIRAKDKSDIGDTSVTVYDYYIRIKVYTDRGREKLGTVDLTYGPRGAIKYIEARTIKPDGTILDLKKDAIFEREVVKSRYLKLKAKSFALPGVEPGCIIEYRWREEVPFRWYKRIHCQREIPVRRVTVWVTPHERASFGTGRYSHGVNPSALENQKGGSLMTYVTNLPAFKEEPSMPPEDQVRGWMLFYYGEDFGKNPGDYWKKLGKSVWDDAKSIMRQNDDVRQKAAELVAGATSDDEKLRKIYEFCRSEIKNADDDASFTQEQRAKLKKNDSPSDTLKRKVGTGRDISMLFGSLVRAVGMDARYARLPDRGDVFFDMNFPDEYFLTTWDIAVKVGDKWRFFDPGSMYVEYGMLRWREEGVQALISDPKEPFFYPTPVSPYSRTLTRRTADLALTADGAIEGDVVMEYTGHWAAILKENHDEESLTEREEAVKEMVKQSLKTAELSQISLENITALDQPFVYKFHIRVPDYAQKTGKRLFLQPAFFQKGDPPRFSSSERTHAVYFNYPWEEQDKLTIQLPEDYALESPEMPAPLSAGQVSRHETKATIQGNKLSFQRTFFFDGLLFQKEQYPALKAYFDDCHKNDNATLTLKQTTTQSQAADKQ
jgi:hypothetical protein